MPDKQAALDAALAQIDAHFGKGPDTPDRRRIRAHHRMGQLVPALEGARKAVAREKELGDEGGTIAIDPFAAYAASWFLRRESDRDDCPAEAWDAMEGAAEDIGSGEIFGDAEELLHDLEEEIGRCAYVIEHGQEPPTPTPLAYAPVSDGGDGLPF